MEPTKRATALVASVGAVVLSLGVPAAAGPDRLATAEAAMTELTAALPDAFSVPGGNAFADVPECDVADESEALVTEAGEEVQQDFGLTSGGVSARIVVFDATSSAKRFFKLMTGARARVCVAKTIAASMPGGATTDAIESDLDKRKLPGVKRSVVFEGPITIGATAINQYEAYVRVDSVVIQVNLGEVGTSSVKDAVEQWAIDTAKSF